MNWFLCFLFTMGGKHVLLFHQVYGDGTQTRSFQYVSDLVEGLILLMNGNYSQPVNLGNPEEHTIQEFAVLIRQIVGGSGKIENKPAVVDDPRRRKPDITLAKNVLGWSPKVIFSMYIFTSMYLKLWLVFRKFFNHENVI